MIFLVGQRPLARHSEPVPWIPVIGVAAVVCFAVAALAAWLALRRPAVVPGLAALLEVATALELQMDADGAGASGRVGRAQVLVGFRPQGRGQQLLVEARLPRPLGLGLGMRRRSDPGRLEVTDDGVELTTPHPELEGWIIRAQQHNEVAQLLGPRVRQSLGNLRTGKDTEVVVDDLGCRAVSNSWKRDAVWLRQHVLAVVRVAGVLDSETAKVALADTMDVLSETHPS